MRGPQRAGAGPGAVLRALHPPRPLRESGVGVSGGRRVLHCAGTRRAEGGVGLSPRSDRVPTPPAGAARAAGSRGRRPGERCAPAQGLCRAPRSDKGAGDGDASVTAPSRRRGGGRGAAGTAARAERRLCGRSGGGV
jgi:hypothetical protein